MPHYASELYQKIFGGRADRQTILVQFEAEIVHLCPAVCILLFSSDVKMATCIKVEPDAEMQKLAHFVVADIFQN